MKYPKLFKATATGAIQEWQIFFNGNEFYTISGQVDGKKIKSAVTKCQGKNIGKANETTPAEQAKAEATAKWIKKTDEGYTQEISQVGNLGLRVNPMLAKKYEDYKEHGFPVYCQYKYDGLRCVLTREGAYSRLWKPFATIGHISESLKKVFANYPNVLAFDGELYSHDLKNDFEEIISIVKQPKASKEDIERCKSRIKYFVYDLVTTNDLDFEQRNSLLSEIFTNNDLPYLHQAETKKARSQCELDEHFRSCIALGYEGQMVRIPHSLYQRKRTKDLLKRKAFIDEEFKIIGYKDGRGGREGCIILELELPNGNSFDSVPKGPIKYLRKLWGNRERLIGLLATVKYQKLTAKGVPHSNNTIKIRSASGDEIAL